jgi:hypothetical protein
MIIQIFQHGIINYRLGNVLPIGFDNMFMSLFYKNWYYKYLQRRAQC